MHPELIKAELRMRGSSLSIVARELGISQSAVCNVTHGCRSRRVETYIAQVLGMPVADVFPQRYPTSKAK